MLSTNDKYLNEILAVDDGYAVTGMRQLGHGKKTAYPEFPDEKPTKKQLIDWCETWRSELESNGYGAMLR